MSNAELRIATDPHGAAMLDFLNGSYDGSFQYVRSDGVATSFDIGGRFKRYVDFSPVDKRVCSLAYGRVLDVGCGSGKHVVALRELGTDCIGIDNSLFVERIWRHRGYEGLHMMDAFNLTFGEESFDTVTLFANGLSIGGTPEGVGRLLTELHRVTRESGCVLVTSIDVTASQSDQDRAYHLANIAAGLLPGQLTLRCRYRDVEGPAFAWLLLSPGELTQIIKGTGWEIAEAHGYPKGVYAARLVKTARVQP